MVDKNMIYKMAFKTIKDSLNWSYHYENDGRYCAYIDGVTSFAMALLEELEKYNNDAVTAMEH